MYVGVIAGFSKNMGTTIYGMTTQYWKSVVGFKRTYHLRDNLAFVA
jgi:hypothetical protein